MVKRSSIGSQDHFKVKGGETGRRTYASDRAELKKAATSARVGAVKAPEAAERGAKATGAGTSTAARGKKRQGSKSKKQDEDAVRQETVARMVEAQVPRAAPGRMLPPARASTELGDFLRVTRGDYQTLRRASRDLYESLVDLARTPARLVRLLRVAAAREGV